MPRWDENVQAQSSPWFKEKGWPPLDIELPLLEYLDKLKGHLLRADTELTGGGSVLLDLTNGIDEWIELHK